MSPKWTKLVRIQKPEIEIKSYSQHEVKPIGKCDIKCAWKHAPDKPFWWTFYIMQNTENIFGRDMLMKFQLNLLYGDNIKLQINTPPEMKGITNCESRGEEELTLTNEITITLQPKQTLHKQEFTLPIWNQYEIGDKVIVSQCPTDNKIYHKNAYNIPISQKYYITFTQHMHKSTSFLMILHSNFY